MATFNYAKSATTALGLLVKFGNLLTYQRNTVVLDPVTGLSTKVTGTNQLQSVLLPAKSSGINAIAGQTDDWLKENVLTGKLRYVIAAAKGSDYVPAAEDLIQVEDETYKIIGVTPLGPAGIRIIYKIGAVLIGPTPIPPPDPDPEEEDEEEEEP